MEVVIFDPLKRYKIEDKGYSSPCWIWLGHIGPNGYGQYYPRNRLKIYAHRYFFIKFKGPIPYGLEINHLCKIRCCVNPSHLEVVSHRTNIRRRGGIKWLVNHRL